MISYISETFKRDGTVWRPDGVGAICSGDEELEGVDGVWFRLAGAPSPRPARSPSGCVGPLYNT